MVGFSRALVLALSVLGWTALPASAVEIMVVGNISSEAGLNETAAAKKLKALMTKLYSYEGVNPIVYAANVSKAALEPPLNEFEDKLAEADFVIFYFIGLSAHDPSGESFLVPHGWNGGKSELVALKDILGKMRAAANGKSLLIVDAVEPAQWKYESIYPGLGDIEREARDGGVLIAYNHGEALSTKDGTQFTASFEKRLSGPLELRQLASLLQEDVSFETSGADVPRLAGAISASLQLNLASREESTRKKKQVCTAANEQTAAKMALVSNGPEPASSNGAVTAAGIVGDSDAAVTVATAMIGDRPVTGNSLFPWFFCPGDAEPEEDIRPARPTVRRAPAPRNERPAGLTRLKERRERPAVARERPAVSRHFAYEASHGGGTPAAVRAAVPGG
jgi:hypothetical protein